MSKFEVKVPFKVGDEVQGLFLADMQEHISSETITRFEKITKFEIDEAGYCKVETNYTERLKKKIDKDNSEAKKLYEATKKAIEDDIATWKTPAPKEVVKEDVVLEDGTATIVEKPVPVKVTRKEPLKSLAELEKDLADLREPEVLNAFWYINPEYTNLKIKHEISEEAINTMGGKLEGPYASFEHVEIPITVFRALKQFVIALEDKEVHELIDVEKAISINIDGIEFSSKVLKSLIRV